jgi:pimeloyl-ACP methyl ester carboxylesterase
MNSFVLCVRDEVSNSNLFGGSIGSVSYLQVPDSAPEPLPSHKLGDVKQWLDGIVKQAIPIGVEAGKELDIVFFVHGYNTDAKEALVRQRLVEAELRKRQFECMVIGFDWPTAGSAAAYAYDRFEAQDAASFLVKGGIIPFANYTLQDCPINVHIMAHSMGGFVVREAFRAVDKGRDADLANDWRIGQLVLFAADISSESFSLNNSDMVPVFNHCGRLTNYFSGYDEALAVSNIKNIDISSRVGRVGMPTDTPAHEKALDVDCGPRYAAVPDRTFLTIHGMTSHSWYLEDPIWYDDLAFTLKGQIDRNAIPTRTRVGENDFVLKSSV